MRHGHLVVVLALVLALGAGCSSATVVRRSETPASKVVSGEGNYRWTEKDGWVRPKRGDWGPPEQVRAESGKAFDAARYADALDGYLTLEKTLPEADPSMGELHFKIGECYYNLGNYDKAIEAYTEVYRKYKPSDKVLNDTFRRVYDIAMDYVRRKADCSFLFIRYDCPEHGSDLLLGEQGLITEYPYLSFADDAIMEIANYYYDSKQYPEAVPLYSRLIRDYPDREWRELAQYQLAMSIFKQVRGVDYDQVLITDAERKFRSYLEDNPRGQKAEDARGKLRELTEMQGEAYLRKASFYLRESQPAAAKIYLRLVLEKYTSSAAARRAREIQRQLDEAESVARRSS